ncbi:MAG: NAD(P)-dependent oxidoreductase [Melioribacteraceae bacterium]|nr:NAD(P)-dependent oxidoreductase [Melioribacteraceae bacterium]
MKIGLIGTGLMGKPLAEKIISSNYSLNVFNRSLAKTKELEKMGAKVFNDVFALVKLSDVIILMLSDYDAVYEILFGNNVGHYEGKTIIQMGTIAPSESKELERKINNMRGEYFESPVLGSIPQIKSGELIVLVGGTLDQYQKWKSLFSVFSNKVLHIGKIGDASAMKLALNQLIVSETVAFSMSLGYLRENNLNVDTFMDILKGSALYAPTFEKKLPNMLSRDFTNPNFPLKHLLKDLDLMLGAFGEKNINTNSLKGIRKILVDTIQNGYADHDYSALYNGIHPDGTES